MEKSMEVAVIAVGTVSSGFTQQGAWEDQRTLSFPGRDQKGIASMAYKVAQTKTLLDNLGKDLTADWKAKAKVVDEERKRMREELDALKDQVRTPLTEFENREKERVAALEKRIELIKALAIDVDESGNKLSSKQLAERLVAAKGVDIESFEEMVTDAALAKDKAIAALEAHVARREREEAEAAELERLRKEAAERERTRTGRVDQARSGRKRSGREAEEAARKEREQRAGEGRSRGGYYPRTRRGSAERSRGRGPQACRHQGRKRQGGAGEGRTHAPVRGEGADRKGEKKKPQKRQRKRQGRRSAPHSRQ